MDNLEDRFWLLIDDIGWGTKTTNKEEIGRNLESSYSEEYLRAFYWFVKCKRHILVGKLNKHSFQQTGNPYSYYGVGDDSFWDLTAHIVGLGKETFNRIAYSDPEEAKTMADNGDFTENFEYIFHYMYKDVDVT